MKRRSLSDPTSAAPATGAARSSRKPQPPAEQRRLFVLDTNVLMHDPAAIFRFDEHDLYLPMVVLEELDAHKKGASEASRNVRQVSRFLDEMIRGASKAQIDLGLPIPTMLAATQGKRQPSGRLFFQTERHAIELVGDIDSFLPFRGGVLVGTEDGVLIELGQAEGDCVAQRVTAQGRIRRIAPLGQGILIAVDNEGVDALERVSVSD